VVVGEGVEGRAGRAGAKAWAARVEEGEVEAAAEASQRATKANGDDSGYLAWLWAVIAAT
jgi:hypothetical protein